MSKNSHNLAPYILAIFLIGALAVAALFVVPTLTAQETPETTLSEAAEETPGEDTAANNAAAITSAGSAKTSQSSSSKTSSGSVDEALAIPVLKNGHKEQIIQHYAYTTSYNPTWKIPNWVAYCLTAQETSGDCKRESSFSPDPAVKSGAVEHRDYSNSGYDRGHMAPAADFKWSKQAMQESFYTTNICPQNQNLNRGDWNDIEELVRDLAKKYGAIYIACGPVVTDTKTKIGQEHKVVVPQGFYKVLLRKTNTQTGYAAIGFYCANEAGSRPIMTYGRSVDEIEEMTGIDFFPALPDEIENEVEKDYDFSLWTVD